MNSTQAARILAQIMPEDLLKWVAEHERNKQASAPAASPTNVATGTPKTDAIYFIESPCGRQ